MSSLEKLGEIRQEGLKNDFMPKAKILENPNKDEIFEHLTALTNEIMKENSALVKTVLREENLSPEKRKEILEELEKCRKEGMSVMQESLEKLNLISES
jgi:ribosomal protein L16 Arg81 hydroxylase